MLVKDNSILCLFDQNTAIPELSNISNILEQIEPTINDVNNNLTKQEHITLKETTRKSKSSYKKNC